MGLSSMLDVVNPLGNMINSSPNVSRFCMMQVSCASSNLRRKGCSKLKRWYSEYRILLEAIANLDVLA